MGLPGLYLRHYSVRRKQAMGWLANLKSMVNAVDTEYDRRIRAASNVREYNSGGHAVHSGGDHHAAHELEDERLEGEGGMTGPLQSNAGPQTETPH